MSLKPCSTESTAFRVIHVVNSLFYREGNLSFFAHSFFSRGSSRAGDGVSIHEAFTFRISPCTVILQNSGSHWRYAREEDEKLCSDHSRLHRPDFTWQLPAVMGNTQTPGEVGKSRICSCCGAEAWESAACKGSLSSVERSRGMAIGLPSAARRLNSWERSSRNISFWWCWVCTAFVRVCVCIYVDVTLYMMRLGQCVSWKSLRHNMGKGRKEVVDERTANGNSMSHCPVCSSQMSWKCLISNAPLTYFPDCCTDSHGQPPTRLSGGSTSHAYIHACLVVAIGAQGCLAAFAVPWQEKLVPETVFYILCHAREFCFGSCQYLCSRQAKPSASCSWPSLLSGGQRKGCLVWRTSLRMDDSFAPCHLHISEGFKISPATGSKL